jgi:hypothetical protein
VSRITAVVLVSACHCGVAGVAVWAATGLIQSSHPVAGFLAGCLAYGALAGAGSIKLKGG